MIEATPPPDYPPAEPALQYIVYESTSPNIGFASATFELPVPPTLLLPCLLLSSFPKEVKECTRRSFQ
jgi:hypothetical protein